MSRIALIRHGTTMWNQEGRTQGVTDIRLNEEGRSQARALAERLSRDGWRWQAVYSSDLSRARQTAEIVAERLGIRTVVADERLRERNGGLTEGTTEQERVRRWGERWREIELGLESAEAVAARGSQCIKGISRQCRGKPVLIVSHSALIRNSLKRLMPSLPVGRQLEHTSVTILNRTEQGWECELYNCSAHLSSLG